MKQAILYAAIVLFAVCRLFAGDETMNHTDWSATVNGLQARLTLVEKEPKHGVRWLVPYLELRNVRDLVNAMEVDCSREHLKVELVNKDGEVVLGGWTLPRSGPAPELPTVTLPFDSSMRISLECTNWGIGKTAAMVQTDSGAWNIAEDENGKVCLRATLTADEKKPEWKMWYGETKTPLIPVEWSKSEKQ